MRRLLLGGLGVRRNTAMKPFSASLVLIAALLAPAPAFNSPSAGPFQKWTRSGTGMVTDLVVADLDGDGSKEVVVGGRGVGVIDAASAATG
ncbi:MAG TPA: hypothetical protein VJ719_00695, partial [Chthoniobacterales bacterium]|nr:hypothetical protein [Chthoniobacterales bacterium]